MKNYKMFFQTSIHAHFVALIVALYRLYENNKNTINIPQLLKLTEKHHPFPQREETEIKEIYTVAAPYGKKLPF